MVCVIAWLRGAVQRCFFAYHPGFFKGKSNSLPPRNERYQIFAKWSRVDTRLNFIILRRKCHHRDEPEPEVKIVIPVGSYMMHFFKRPANCVDSNVKSPPPINIECIDGE